jgi:hypothetical protein
MGGFPAGNSERACSAGYFMKKAAVLVLLAVACSSTTTVIAAPSATLASNDARICELALQPPWNAGAIEALTRAPTTPIEVQAAEVNELFATTNSDAPVRAWDDLNGMCVDAGF